MNKIDLLLKIDKTKLVRPTKEVEVKRLSEILGEPFTVVCQALTSDEFGEIQESVSMSSEGDLNLERNLQANYIVKGVKDPCFTNQQVIEYFGATKAIEAVNKIFLPGEITALFNTINQLSGFAKGSVEEVKNSSTQTEK